MANPRVLCKCELLFGRVVLGDSVGIDVGIGGRALQNIAFAEPLQQVSVAAAAGTEG